MSEKFKKSEWQKKIDEWREDVDRQLAILFAALNEIDPKIEGFEDRLVNTNKQVMKLMGIKE